MDIRMKDSIKIETDKHKRYDTDNQNDINKSETAMQIHHSSSIDYWRQRRVTSLITLSSFGFGYSVGIMNVCILPNKKGSILKDIQLNTSESEYVTASLFVGGILGAIVTNYPAELYGRKPVLIISNLICILGFIICALSATEFMLYCGRVLLGIGIGIVNVVVPLLLTEISSTVIRGHIISFHHLMIMTGLLASGIIGYVLVDHYSHGWKLSQIVPCVPALVQVIFCRYIPESPRWLLKEQKKTEAINALQRVRPSYSSLDIKNTYNNIGQQVLSGHSTDLSSYKRLVTIGCVLVIYQGSTGIHIVNMYSATILRYAGMNNILLGISMIGLMHVFASMAALMAVDKFGRRKLLIISGLLMSLSMGFISFILDINSTRNETDLIIFLLILVGSYDIGLGCVTWTVLGELFPTTVRSKAMSCFMVVKHLCAFVCACTALSLIDVLGGENGEKLGLKTLFGILSILCCTSCAFVYWFIPETRQQPLDEVPHPSIASTTSKDNVSALSETVCSITKSSETVDI